MNLGVVPFESDDDVNDTIPLLSRLVSEHAQRSFFLVCVSVHKK